VLAPLELGQFVPNLGQSRAVVAHWAMTVRYFERRDAAARFFARDTPDEEREALLAREGVTLVVRPGGAAWREGFDPSQHAGYDGVPGWRVVDPSRQAARRWRCAVNALSALRFYVRATRAPCATWSPGPQGLLGQVPSVIGAQGGLQARAQERGVVAIGITCGCAASKYTIGRGVYLDHAYCTPRPAGSASAITAGSWAAAGRTFNYRGIANAGIHLGTRVFTAKNDHVRQGGTWATMLFAARAGKRLSTTFTDPNVPIMQQGITAQHRHRRQLPDRRRAIIPTASPSAAA
jgi:hypothetical protein